MTLKETILSYMSTTYGAKGEWAGKLCREIHEITKSKEAIIERRMRELAEDKLLDKCHAQINDKGPHYTRYRLTQ